MPKVVDNMLDAKAEVDARLRGAITDFTSQFAARITAPVATPIKNFPLNEAPARTAKVRQNTQAELPFLRQKIEDYITDARTRDMLAAAAMQSVTQAYEDWFDGVYTAALNGSGTAVKGKGKGKGREDGVWDPEVFEDWCANAFRVGEAASLGLGILGDGMEGGSGSEDGSDAGSLGGVSGRTGTVGTGRGSKGGLSTR